MGSVSLPRRSDTTSIQERVYWGEGAGGRGPDSQLQLQPAVYDPEQVIQLL